MKTMTRFEKDYNEIKNNSLIATVILKKRKAQLEKLEHEGKSCKNEFRRMCIVQEFVRLKREYDILDDLV